MSIFEKAARLKIRYETTKGAFMVEDLWDLPLQSKSGKINLDDIAISLNRKLKTADSDVSFVDEARESDPTIQLMFDIVRHIIVVKKDENRQIAEQKDRAEKKQRLLEIMKNRKDKALENMSDEDLAKELAAL